MDSVGADLLTLFKIACRSDSTVLLTGKTGTGKSCLARKIHLQSRRHNKPFVVVNLASLNEGILESELFGHERGSFTGAEHRRLGRLEMAQGGTVFLDEVAELPPRLQARLLEFLQSKKVSPVGSNREVQLDVRVIAATHKDLVWAVKRGEFREDLLHRIRVISIPLKALRERYDELEGLVEGVLTELSVELGRTVRRLAPTVMQIFGSYDWPGNLRELRNALEYAVLANEGGEITLKDLPTWMLESFHTQTRSRPGAGSDPEECADSKRGGDRTTRDTAETTSGEGTRPWRVREPNGMDEEDHLGVAEVSLSWDYYGTVRRFEKEYLRRALKKNEGRINRTARKIGVNKTTLVRRIRDFGLKPITNCNYSLFDLKKTVSEKK